MAAAAPDANAGLAAGLAAGEDTGSAVCVCFFTAPPSLLLFGAPTVNATLLVLLHLPESAHAPACNFSAFRNLPDITP